MEDSWQIREVTWTDILGKSLDVASDLTQIYSSTSTKKVNRYDSPLTNYVVNALCEKYVFHLVFLAKNGESGAESILKTEKFQGNSISIRRKSYGEKHGQH